MDQDIVITQTSRLKLTCEKAKLEAREKFKYLALAVTVLQNATYVVCFFCEMRLDAGGEPED